MAETEDGESFLPLDSESRGPIEKPVRLDPAIYAPKVRRSTVARWGFGVIAFLAFVMAAGAWGQVYRQQRASQPIEIIACTKQSWTIGLTQDQCVRPMTPPENVLVAGESIAVAGDICLDRETSRRYDLTVDWISLQEEGLSFRVFSFPVEWEPGCSQPYDFAYTVPEQLLAQAPPEGADMGLWKIIGRATPQNGIDLRYEWSVTESFRLIVPPAEEG